MGPQSTIAQGIKRGGVTGDDRGDFFVVNMMVLPIGQQIDMRDSKESENPHPGTVWFVLPSVGREL
jgi:hypothetical protein